MKWKALLPTRIVHDERIAWEIFLQGTLHWSHSTNRLAQIPTNQLFVQQLVQASNIENTNAWLALYVENPPVGGGGSPCISKMVENVSMTWHHPMDLYAVNLPLIRMIYSAGDIFHISSSLCRECNCWWWILSREGQKCGALMGFCDLPGYTFNQII